MKKDYVDTSFGQIHYRAEGNGESLLLLHQTGLSSDEFRNLIPSLSKNNEVIALDIMGYGNSDSPPHGFNTETHALSIVQFLDELGIDSISIFGHHSGAAIAVGIAVEYPQRVNKLMLSGCPYLSAGMRDGWFDKASHKPMEIKADGSHIKEWWEQRSERFTYLTPEDIQRMLSDHLKADLGRNAHAASTLVYKYHIESKLPSIKCPTLLITALGDFFNGQYEATMQLIPDCSGYVIDGTHSHPAYENPDKLAQAILSFL